MNTTRTAPSSIDPAVFAKRMANLPGALQTMGFDALRPGQDKMVASVMANRDIFGVLPTGAGKSAVYIIPTMCCGWRTLIFSPLISLMQDQVESLWEVGLKAGQLSSGQTQAENNSTIAQWESGDLQFLLVAPERLQNEGFKRAISSVKPNLVVIDEAHCLSAWGGSFRPNYSRIGDFIKEACPEVVLCLTATAPEDVEADIRRILDIPKALKVVYYPTRTNLKLSSRDWKDDVDLLKRLEAVDGSCIVYCSTVKRTEELYTKLHQNITNGALIYNGQMNDDEKVTNQNMFMRGETRVMFATNAFGLGIDKSDVRGVFHRDVPNSIDSLAQESGRASRDGKDATCCFLFDPSTYATQQWFIQNRFPSKQQIESVLMVLKRNAQDNICKMTIKDIACQLNMQGELVSSALNEMTAAGVLARSKDDANIVKIKFRRDHMLDELREYQTQIEKIAYLDREGFLEFDLDQLIVALDVKPKKVKDNLKLYDKEGYVQYIPPFRGKSTQIVGDLGMVDFPRLVERHREAKRKLNLVIDYHKTPDDRKHDFLHEYFGTLEAS